MRWRTVNIDCFEAPQTGKVSIAAQGDDKGISALSVNAFGRSFTLETSDLQKIHSFPLDSLKVTHEAGYPQLGGHTVHFKFHRRYYDKEQKPHDEEGLVSVSKGKGLEVAVHEKQGGG